MLTIIVGDDSWDEERQEFLLSNQVELHLEHSLVSLSKWESKWEKPFLTALDKTSEETLSYIECMVIDPNFSPEVFSKLSQDNFEDIKNYIDAKMTATWFRDTKTPPRSSEIVTSELIYYWLTVFNIPFEVQTWHLNRLFTLIKIANLKNAKPTKMGKGEMAQRNRELNAQRRSAMNTKG